MVTPIVKQSTQFWGLKVDLGSGPVRVLGITSIKEPSPKPQRVEVPDLDSQFVEKANIGISDPGDMTADIFTNQADATHLALRLLLNTPASKHWYIVDANDVTVSDFMGTLIDFPRNIQQGQVLKGSLTVSLDGLPNPA